MFSISCLSSIDLGTSRVGPRDNSLSKSLLDNVLGDLGISLSLGKDNLLLRKFKSSGFKTCFSLRKASLSLVSLADFSSSSSFGLK